MNKKGPVIAIDGPAGTGKSTAARFLAECLHFIHVDTGALYRAIALLTLNRCSKTGENEQEAAKEIIQSVNLEFRLVRENGPMLKNCIFVNGRDQTAFIRTLEVTQAASRISAFSEVRAYLLGLQRRLGCVGKTILEGRDIGTVVFPDADLKFFLSARLEERVKRRLAEMKDNSLDSVASYETIKAQMRERDEADSTRAVAPLKKAEDAIEIDTSSMNLSEVVKMMESLARNQLKLK